MDSSQWTDSRWKEHFDEGTKNTNSKITKLYNQIYDYTGTIIDNKTRINGIKINVNDLVMDIAQSIIYFCDNIDDTQLCILVSNYNKLQSILSSKQPQLLTLKSLIEVVNEKLDETIKTVNDNKKHYLFSSINYYKKALARLVYIDDKCKQIEREHSEYGQSSKNAFNGTAATVEGNVGGQRKNQLKPKVRTGPRGGKYIVVNNKKRYI